VWLLLMAAVGISIPPLPVEGQPPTEGTGEAIQVIRETDTSILLAFSLPKYTLQQISTPAGTFTQVSVAGWSSGAAPGHPQLPQRGALIGLSPETTPSLEIIEWREKAVPLHSPIYPAPQPIRPAESASPPRLAFAMDEDTYVQDRTAPAEAVTIAQVGWMRHQRVAQLACTPFRYNPVQGILYVTQEIVIEVHTGHAETSLPHAAPPTPDAFEAVYRTSLLNYERARQWRVQRPPSMSGAGTGGPATLPNSYKIIVHADGLYRLSYADLQAAGLPVETIEPHTWQLYEHNAEVDILVTGEGDGSFDPGDSILFYGRVPPSRYTAYNVYWLRYGTPGGARMSTRAVPPDSHSAGALWATARYAENRRYDPLVSGADGDHWYGADLRPNEPGEIALDLQPLDTAVPTATLQAGLVGYTHDNGANPDHHAVVTVNGSDVIDAEWEGKGAFTATKTLDRALLAAGENQVTIRLPGDTGAAVEGAWLDTVQIAYPIQSLTADRAHVEGQPGARRYTLGGFSTNNVELYDVSVPQHPVRLQNTSLAANGGAYTLSFSDGDPASTAATYFALAGSEIQRPAAIVADTPSDLQSAAHGADYLIIAPAEFAAAVHPLVAHRQAQGLRIETIDVQDIYDEYAGGRLHPPAIRSFIADAYAFWTLPAPAYVLLVGDGSYDFLDHYGYGPSAQTYIPPYLAAVDLGGAETAADHFYATVAGKDPWADVMLGRLPVASAAEATTVVAKIVAYENDPWPGNWNARHLFVADDTDPWVGNFGDTSDVVYNAFIADPWIGQRIYLDDWTDEQARAATLSALNQGSLLVSYFGHSSWHQWASENLLHVSDVSDLHNGAQLPVMLSMTCYTGFFQHPEYGTLDESLLRREGGGTVATWSPSGLGLNTGHQHLHYGFYRSVLTGGQVQLGAATNAAKAYLYAQAPAQVDLLYTFHLFGDPAMALNLTMRPWPHSIYLPSISQQYSGG
jgi:hypothetical protein